MSSKPSDPPHYERIRILSLDGGGIYGLTSALLLRKLCERDCKFLTASDTDQTFHMFAGTSSGAVNALLMAKYDNPRDAVMSGELEAFWQESSVFHSGVPGLGALGITAQYAAQQFLAQLHRYFGYLRLGELRHHVLISAFNWTGATGHERDPDLLAGSPNPDRQLFTRFRPPPHRSDTRAGQYQRHWKPKFFDNFMDDDDDFRVLAAHVAYVATAPPGLRPLIGGLGDGGSFNANPSVPALARVTNVFRVRAQQQKSAGAGEAPGAAGLGGILELLTSKRGREEFWRQSKRAAKGAKKGGVEGEASEDLGTSPREHQERVGGILERTALLSVGSGQVLPHSAFQMSNFGPLSAMMMPSNPMTGAWLSPAWYSLDAASEESDYIVKQLLTTERTLRLNPPLNPVPTVMAAMMARSNFMRQQLIRSIYSAVDGPEARHAIDETVKFIRRDYQTREPPTPTPVRARPEKTREREPKQRVAKGGGWSKRKRGD